VNYVSFSPARPLGDFVERLWHFSDAPPHAKERIVPSGTVEIVINLREDELRIYDATDPGCCRRFSGTVVSGAYSGCFVIDTLEHASIIGAHFRPGGAFPFFGMPISELADRHVGLETLWGAAAPELRERLCAAVTPAERFVLLEKTLASRLCRALERHYSVRFALDAFGQAGSVPRVGRVAQDIGLSRRRFIEVFKQEVGMAPKMFCRVRRFQQALALTRRETEPDWAQLAPECGYFDQSHFIQDFRAFSGLTPTQYVRQRSERVLENHVPLAG
jgi:AraC-like DNA-binding protein